MTNQFQSTKEIDAQVVAIRRHLHQYPELSFKEFETARYIGAVLEEWGIPYERIGETGIFVDIVGDKNGPAIGLRADIDALPIQEEAEVPFKSTHQQVMHACGHDGHTAILLGAVYELHHNKTLLKGTVRCIFQPGEEADGAALALIKLGILKNPHLESITGLHLWPYLPMGTVGVKSGSMTASCDDFKITISGKSGHSARPHQAVDAILVASHIMQTLQLVAAKNINPTQPKVIHIGKIYGGEASNIVADHVVMEGTYRALNSEVRSQLRAELERVCRASEIQWDVKIDIEFLLGAPQIENEIALVSEFIKTASELLGEEKVVDLPEPSMGADDFGYFSEKIPSLYFRLGIKKEDETTYDLHHPRFHFDDAVLATGVSLYVNYAINLLQNVRR